MSAWLVTVAAGIFAGWGWSRGELDQADMLLLFILTVLVRIEMALGDTARGRKP